MQTLLPSIINCSQTAGKIILSIYEGAAAFSITQKENNSPLTSADLAAHHHIVNVLTQLTPDWPILSEESATTAYEQRKYWSKFWLVDPLDGTKEFIKRNGEFTVNIALIDNGQPILGVVYAPVLRSLYYATKHSGAYFQNGDTAAIKIKTSLPQAGEPWKIMASRSHHSQELDSFLSTIKHYELINKGSSLKFCLVAAGHAHIYPRFGLTSQWDTAASQCILEEAGGIIKNINGEPLDYFQTETLLNPYFIAAAHENIFEEFFISPP